MAMFDDKAETLSVSTLVWMARQGGSYARAAQDYVNDLAWLVRSSRKVELPEEN